MLKSKVQDTKIFKETVIHQRREAKKVSRFGVKLEALLKKYNKHPKKNKWHKL